MLEKLTRFIIKRPVKIMIFSIIVILIFVAGAVNVRMATGNETLVDSETEVFKNNEMLENEFGGEAIILLYEGLDDEDVISVANIEHMSQLQQQLSFNRNIYSMISPLTLIEQISKKQYETFTDGISDVASGLDEMGEKLNEIGEEMASNLEEPQSSLPDVDRKLSDLTEGLNKMIEGQEKLKHGTVHLVNGYESFGGNIEQLTDNFQKLIVNIENSSKTEITQQQIQQLKQMNNQLITLSEKMFETAGNTKQLPSISDNTINGLNGIADGFETQVSTIGEIEEEQQEQTSQLQQLADGLIEMGGNLIEISDNLTTMHSFSDTFTSSIPKSQSTLNEMIYTDEGLIRDMYSEVIIDEKYLLMMIKFNDSAADKDKSDVITVIRDYIEENPLSSTDIIVSGKPVLDDAIRTSMQDNMKKMMMLSMLFMILVLTIVFKVRWRILPLAIILVAVIGTVGLMGWLGIPITMVSMAVFPILIGLGIDYAIQFQSRYVEEMTEEEGV